MISCITPNNHWLNLFFFSTGASLRHNKLGIYDSLELTPTTQLEHTYTQAHKHTHTHTENAYKDTDPHLQCQPPHSQPYPGLYTHSHEDLSPRLPQTDTHTHTKLFHPHTHMSNQSKKKCDTLLDLCVSSLRRGHANLLCIVPILTDDLRRGSNMGRFFERSQF